MVEPELQDFSNFPDDAQLWIYAFERPLSEADRRSISRHLENFIEGWASHGRQVRGEYRIALDRFVLLTGYLTDGISGCSIDSSVRVFKELRDQHGLDSLNRSLVFYRDSEGEIQAVPFLDFGHRVESGEIKPDTPVFDTTLQRLGELRQGKLEQRFSESWHSLSYQIPTGT